MVDGGDNSRDLCTNFEGIGDNFLDLRLELNESRIS